MSCLVFIKVGSRCFFAAWRGTTKFVFIKFANSRQDLFKDSYFLMITNTDVRSAQRVERTANIVLQGAGVVVFPLFGPIEEMKWADGWEPEILNADTQVREKMMFRTPSAYADEECYTWAVVKYLPERYKIEYMVSSRNRVWFITVECSDREGRTHAQVTYSYTGFDAVANARNRESLERMFCENLKDWERMINHFILTGEKLKS
jgi:hypothetical protein